ncbi:MAG: hypothetical protein ABIF40_02540 [archaeon]
MDKIPHTSAQERLFKQLEIGKDKFDFSPFDIYQHVDETQRNSFFENQEEELINVKQDLIGSLRSAELEILIFSGNISWSNLIQNNKPLIEVFEELAEKNVSIKFLANVDLNSQENIVKMNSINDRICKDRVEVRHCMQPLRAFIVDNKFVKFKEINDPSLRGKTCGKKTYIFYEIFDEHWVDWMRKVFWNYFRSSIPAKKRIENLKTLQKL